MKYLQPLIYFVIFQLSLVFGRSNRHLTLTYNSNAACISINQTLPNTKITLDFHNVEKEQVPLVVSSYFDLFKFKNVPNFDNFANHTYLDEKKPFVKTRAKSKRVKFDLDLVKSIPFPDDFYNKTIKKDGRVEYKVPRPGVYCVYLPMYSFDGIGTHPLDYYVDVNVVNEAISPNVLNEISTQVNMLILFGTVVITLALIYPSIRTAGGVAKLPPILKELFPFLVTNLVYRVGFFGLWVFYFFYPSDSIYNFVLNYYSRVQPVLLDKWLQYLVASVYLGSGYLNLPIKPSGIWLKLIFGVNVLVALVQVETLSNIWSINEISINDVPYGIVDKSILVTRNYRYILTTYYSDFVKRAVTISNQVQAVSEIATQVLSLVYGIRIFWYLKKKSNKRLSKVMLQSILVHLIAWSYFGRSTIHYLYINMKFSGVFDVAELLGVIGNVIEMFYLKLMGLKVFEVLLLWVIWGTKTPYNVAEPERKEDKKKRH